MAYFLRHLRQFYKKEIKCEEIENVLFRLSLGCKSFPDKSDIPGRADAINVLTQIDGADKLFEEIAGKTNKPFRKHYDVLSEFCHPNLLGLTVAADILDGETIVYYKQPEFTENDFGVLINDMLMSCTIFFCIFDESLSLLENNERIPTLIKPDK
ncbi:MAG: hypothetical protein MUO85_04955 [candidate division Zixibacteria bacterium]|nr:hypothetical protein [candidate division Zixibacteria bacterium]